MVCVDGGKKTKSDKLGDRRIKSRRRELILLLSPLLEFFQS